MIKKLFAAAALSLLAACASQPRGALSLIDLEKPRYLLTERSRLPVDFARAQQNLFRHARVCGVNYEFQIDPIEASYARVMYREEPGAGWDKTVLLNLVLLHNRTVNIKAYSYYAGQLERAHRMFAAILKPEMCEPDSSWENGLGGFLSD